jgi:hypothetical protein
MVGACRLNETGNKLITEFHLEGREVGREEGRNGGRKGDTSSNRKVTDKQ